MLVMHFSAIAVFQLLGSSVRLQSLHELTMHRYIELSIAVLMILWLARRKSDSYWSLLSFPSYLKFNRETSFQSRIFRLIVRRPDDGSGIKYKGEIEQ